MNIGNAHSLCFTPSRHLAKYIMTNVISIMTTLTMRISGDSIIYPRQIPTSIPSKSHSHSALLSTAYPLSLSLPVSYLYLQPAPDTVQHDLIHHQLLHRMIIILHPLYLYHRYLRIPLDPVYFYFRQFQHVIQRILYQHLNTTPAFLSLPSIPSHSPPILPTLSIPALPKGTSLRTADIHSLSPPLTSFSSVHTLTLFPSLASCPCLPHALLAIDHNFFL